MAIESSVDRARERVRAEQDAVEAKRAGFDAFLDRVADVPAETAAPSHAKTALGTDTHHGSSSTEGCRAVRTAFAETVRPHCADEDESLLETIRRELGDSVAVGLSSTTGTSLTPAVRGAVITKAEQRRMETRVLGRALDREERQLDAAGSTVDEVAGWIAEADETPLTDLGFDALADRHERLGTFRDRCSELARDRQAFLGETTSLDGDVGLRHRCLVADCYRDFPVTHPVLATVARLDEVCRTCQRSVRAHLVRRV